ncbi:hypothetical protein E2C01_088961 [Portunus trituberculatus]|uniref:Uncharacterized protein n=1 Tax=Portunus trituberculatus TaxID=210409 RepID=A0A5B7JL87_PORTR|nr:hypothetical protein [Portunus trituberculatus]
MERTPSPLLLCRRHRHHHHYYRPLKYSSSSSLSDLPSTSSVAPDDCENSVNTRMRQRRDTRKRRRGEN